MQSKYISATKNNDKSLTNSLVCDYKNVCLCCFMHYIKQFHMSTRALNIGFAD